MGDYEGNVKCPLYSGTNNTLDGEQNQHYLNHTNDSNYLNNNEPRSEYQRTSGNDINQNQMDQHSDQSQLQQNQQTPRRHSRALSGQGGRMGGSRQPGHFSGANSRPTDFPLRMLVLSDMVGAIIGKAGNTIKQITQETRARVDVHRKDNAGSLEKVITIFGIPENCSKACQKIMEVMHTEATTTSKSEVPLKILAHNNLVGRIIGKSGNTIKRIMEETNTKIAVSSNVHDLNSFSLERVITIKGTVEEICRAEQLISAKLRQSYESDLAGLHPGSAGLHHPSMPFPGIPYPVMPGSQVPSQSYLGSGGSGSGSRGGTGGGPPVAGPGQPYQAAMFGSPYLPPMLSGFHHPPGLTPGAPPLNPFAPGPGDHIKETVYLYIPNTAVGAIIGTGGSTIRDMISSSGASIKVSQPKDENQPSSTPSSQSSSTSQQPAGGSGPPPQGQPQPATAASGSATSSSGHHGLGPGPHERKVTIVGTPEAQWKAQLMLYRKVGYESGQSGPQEAHLTVEIMVPSSQVGRIIGKSGQTVRELQRMTHALIKLPEEGHQSSRGDETPVHIKGDFLSTQAAQRQIRAFVSRGATAQQQVAPGQQQAPRTPGGGRGRNGAGTNNSQRQRSSQSPQDDDDEEGGGGAYNADAPRSSSPPAASAACDGDGQQQPHVVTRDTDANNSGGDNLEHSK